MQFFLLHVAICPICVVVKLSKENNVCKFFIACCYLSDLCGYYHDYLHYNLSRIFKSQTDSLKDPI